MSHASPRRRKSVRGEQAGAGTATRAASKSPAAAKSRRRSRAGSRADTRSSRAAKEDREADPHIDLPRASRKSLLQRSDDIAAQQRYGSRSERTLMMEERNGQQRDPLCYTLHETAADTQRQLRSRSGSWLSLPQLRLHVLSLWATLSSLFLPVGYPASVTEDYLQFQIFDTIQALCSYLRGMLCTHAVLTGLGVGEATASATSATLSWVLRDGLGMAGGLLFAWWGSASFGHNVRAWRLFADIVNDVGLTLELVSPLFPKAYFFAFLAVGCLCRSLCGVSSGATRAALMQHFALAGNVADLAAKEGMQETFVTLLGMVGGAALMSWLDGSQRATWLLFAGLTALHVYANWRGVRALVFSTLNPQRADILLTNFVAQMVRKEKEPVALSPAQVARAEKLLWWAGHSEEDARTGQRIRLGVPAHELLTSSALLSQLETAQHDASPPAYLVYPPSQPGASVCVLLRSSADDRSRLRALFHAHVYRILWARNHTPSDSATRLSSLPSVMSAIVRWMRRAPSTPPRETDLSADERLVLEHSTRVVLRVWPRLLDSLDEQGWNTRHIALHTEEWTCEWSWA